MWCEIQPMRGDFSRGDEPPVWLFIPWYLFVLAEFFQEDSDIHRIS